MPDWASSSELLVMLVFLGFLVVELISIRRTVARDRKKAREQADRE
jgi:hypothetical protein